MISMIDSNLITNPKQGTKLSLENIMTMSEKFMLHKEDTEAEEFFKENINGSISAILTRVWDNFHIWFN